MKNNLCQALILCLTLTILCSTAHAHDPWTWTDTALEVLFAGALEVDREQTLEASKYPNRYFETNKVLGEHPDAYKINTWMGACLVGHAAIAYMLPKPYRTAWQGIWIVFEVNQVEHNRKVGLGVSLRF